MNIFLTSPCPRECAQNLDDKRLGTMAKESAQMLAAGTLHYGVDIGYKLTHVNHPCSVWTRKSRLNFSWLVEHGLWLVDEHVFRFGSSHKSLAVIEEAFKHRNLFPNTGPLEFTFNSSGYDTGNVFDDYKRCLVHKWKYTDVRKSTWKYRGRPSFYKPLYNSM